MHYISKGGRIPSTMQSTTRIQQHSLDYSYGNKLPYYSSYDHYFTPHLKLLLYYLPHHWTLSVYFLFDYTVKCLSRDDEINQNE
jgi:hypothetical protein